MRLIYYPILFLLFFKLIACERKEEKSDLTDREKIQRTLDSLSIKINQPVPPSNFSLTYGCDSTPYFKKTNFDTITFLTPGGMTPMTFDYEDKFNSFSKWLETKNSYPPTFPSGYGDDGRINIEVYKELNFIYRNDSLFELELDRDKFQNDLIQELTKLENGTIDSNELERRTDELAKNEENSFSAKKYS